MDIVAVDDHQAGLDLLQMVFEADGHTVRTAGGAAEALDRLGDDVPDVLVTDLMMGPDRRDGFRLIASVRGRADLDGLPVVALTGVTSAHDLAHARAAGADACLTKPIDVTELLRVLRELTSSTRAPLRPARASGRTSGPTPGPPRPTRD